MTTARYRFINFLLKECSGLNYVLLKYVYDDILQIPSDEKLEILIDKEDYKSLLYVISSAREIINIKSKRNVRSQIVNIKFSDHSSLEIKIKIDIERKGIILMNSKHVLRASIVNKQNIKIPAPCHQFEYILLSGILNRNDVEEKFRNYFRTFSFEERSRIFAHICPKYKFILNVLDELYIFSNNNYHKIVHAIETQKQNKGWRYTFHKFVFAYDYLISNFIRGWDHLNSKENNSPDQSNGASELKNLLQRNALIRI
ncbi:MAG TPA: hypothetical protein VJY62_21100 [Bacteroidia bacterium]|nr:hypothetical protein [Bacteroidia bacterium]